MHIYAVQPEIQWESPEGTIAHLQVLLSGMTIEPGSLIVFPEMYSTGFSMNVKAVAEGDARPGEMFLKQVAKQYQCAALGGVVHQLPSGRGVNQAVAFDPQGVELVRYSKIHPFSYGQESAHYDGGDRVHTFDWQGWKIAPLICYDLRFPEAFRVAAVAGAQLLVVIANWPASRIDHWETLLRARAIENQACLVGVNRVGSDPIVAYNGRSVILNAKAHTLAQGDDRAAILHAQLDLAEVQAYRAKFPALADRRYRYSADGFSST